MATLFIMELIQAMLTQMQDSTITTNISIIILLIITITLTIKSIPCVRKCMSIRASIRSPGQCQVRVRSIGTTCDLSLTQVFRDKDAGTVAGFCVILMEIGEGVMAEICPLSSRH